MWDHPITQAHLNTLNCWGWSLISPVSKLLACKDTGNGALANVDTIIGTVRDSIPAIMQSKVSELDSFNVFETLRNCISIKTTGKDTRKQLVSYHTLFCVTINAMLLIGGLIRGPSFSCSTSDS